MTNSQVHNLPPGGFGETAPETAPAPTCPLGQGAGRTPSDLRLYRPAPTCPHLPPRPRGTCPRPRRYIAGAGGSPSFRNPIQRGLAR